jgi:hypothetical protein
MTLLGGRGLIPLGNYWLLASEATSCAVAAGWLLNVIIKHEENPSFNGLLKYLLIFILLNVPAMVKGYEVGNGVGYIFFDISLHLRYVIVGIIAYNIIRNRKDFVKILTLFLICGTLMCIFSLYSFYINPSISEVSTELFYGQTVRAASTLGNPNVFAGFLEFFIPIVLALFFYVKKGVARYLLFISFGIGLWALLLSFSRGGFAAILISISIIIVISPMRVAYKVVPLVIFALLIIVIFVSPTLARQSGIFTGETYEKELLLGNRGKQYGDYFQYISRSLIEGNGWGLEQIGYSFSPKQTGEFIISGLNSFFINILLKGGLLALIGFVILGYGIIRKLLFTMKLSRGEVESYLILGIIAGIAGFFFHQAFDNLLIWPIVGMNFWFLIGIGMLPAKSSYLESKTKHKKEVAQVE